MHKEQRKCMAGMKKKGVICGNTDDLLPSQNMCRSCKAKANRESSAGGYYKDDRKKASDEAAFEELAMFKEIIISWNRVSKG